MPVADALERFKELKEKTSRIRTRQAYATFITRMKEYIKHIEQPKLRLQDLDRNFVQGFMDYLLITKGVGEKTFNNYLIHIKHFFNMLVEREVLQKSQVKGFTKLQTDVGRNMAFSAAQKEHLLKVLPIHPELWLFVQFMYYCLIRPNELRQLQIRNLDLKKQTIVVSSDVSKSRKQDSVVIPDAFMPVLLSQNYSQYPEHCYIFSEAGGPGEIPSGRNTFSRWHIYCLT